jgi:AFG3 family protein
VAVYGMNEKVGLVSFPRNPEAFDKPYSDQTAQLIDEEVRRMIDEAYVRTVGLVRQHKELVAKMAEALLSREVLNLDDVEGLLGLRPFESSSLRNIDRYRNTGEAPAAKRGPEGSDDATLARDGDGGEAGGDDDGDGGVGELLWRRKVPEGALVAT